MTDSERELYENHLMRHFEEPYHRGTTSRATHRHREDNPACGDSVQIELVVDEEGRVSEAWFQAAGCCLSQAAASMLTQFVEGKHITEIESFSALDMLALFRARITPHRQKCCLLAWKACQIAVGPKRDEHESTG